MKFFGKMRKLISGILIGSGVRNITYFVSSYRCMANSNRNMPNNSWNKLFIQMLNLNINKGGNYDCCSKKSSKMF